MAAQPGPPIAPFRRVHVRTVVELGPRLRRVTVGGEQLGPCTLGGVPVPAWRAPGFDDHIELRFGTRSQLERHIPLRLRRNEFDLHVTLPRIGADAHWVRSARTGDPLWFAGPSRSTPLPADADSAILLADDAGLPAIHRFLDERPIDGPVVAIVAVHDGALQMPLPPAGRRPRALGGRARGRGARTR